MTYYERYQAAYDHGYEDGAKLGKLPLAATMLVYAGGVVIGFLIAWLVFR